MRRRTSRTPSGMVDEDLAEVVERLNEEPERPERRVFNTPTPSLSRRESEDQGNRHSHFSTLRDALEDPRATSNVFALFEQSQINEFKEAFNMIDQDHNGFIDTDDLHEMFSSLGKEVTEDFLTSMIKEAADKQINFTMFLTMFGEKLSGTDPEPVLRNAFLSLDRERRGTVSATSLRHLLTSTGDRYTQDQVDELFRDAKIEDGEFDYVDFVRMLKYGTKDKDDLPAS